eukprot:5720975-Pyramimonas_sp.AAC.1
MIEDYEGATIMFICAVGVPGMAFWHDSGSSKRNHQVDPWGWRPENNVWVCFRGFKRLFSKEWK